MREVFVVSAVRSPTGRVAGFLRGYSAPALLGAVLSEAVRRIDLDPREIDDVFTGSVYQIGEQGYCLARMGALHAGFPDEIPGATVNRQCGSGLAAIQLAHAVIAAGDAEVVVASGCEMMSKYPIMSDLDGRLSDGREAGNPFGPMYLERCGVPPNQIASAQMIADRYGISREASEEFAVQSHQRAHRATVAGRFRPEILPMRGLDKAGNLEERDTDETVRPDTSVEKLRGLKVLAGTRWITAGTSSAVTDGASALVLMSGERVRARGLTPLGRLVASVNVGADPTLMLAGPLTATPRVLEKAGLRLEDIDLFEVNEAFAPVPLAWQKELRADPERLNVNGGAIALGHPVGSSGCRLAMTALFELTRRRARYALVTLCAGGGMAPATIFERLG